MTEPIVVVRDGKLRGKVGEDYNGNTFFSFQGIPYAKPPLGKLRFKDPQPPEKWDGVLDATKEGNECYAKQFVGNWRTGSEDCLILNVYTPELPSKMNKLKPVMFWVHGGAFTMGSSRTMLYGPEYLVARDVVLVTINYRLGVLGFLSLDDQSLEVPGNAGLKDMVLGLKWVQRNIQQFSGDPNNVTIFGESAGGAAVHYLILSPITNGLFHKAIIQSGCALNGWAKGKRSVMRLAEILGIESNDEKLILEQLQELSVEELYAGASKISDVFHIGNFRPFAPIIEKASSTAFICEDPIKIMKMGKYNQVPMIIGYNSAEGMLLYSVTTQNPKHDYLLADSTLVPNTMNLRKGSPLYKSVVKRIKKFYFNDTEKDTESNRNNIYKLYTHNCFFLDIYKSANYTLQSAQNPIYFYRFSLETKLNFMKSLNRIEDKGAFHADDIAYLFKTMFAPEKVSNSPEDIGIQKMTKLWSNFAKYGNPTPAKNDALLPVQWTPLTKQQFNCLDIDDDFKMEIDPEKEAVEFWDDLYSMTSKVVSKL